MMSMLSIHSESEIVINKKLYKMPMMPMMFTMTILNIIIVNIPMSLKQFRSLLLCLKCALRNKHLQSLTNAQIHGVMHRHNSHQQIVLLLSKSITQLLSVCKA